VTLTVCGLLGSPFFRKICTQLDEKSIDYEVENLNPFAAGDEFTGLNPVRRIPILKDSDQGDGFILPDSSAIFQYIERKHPEPSLLPADLADYGKALWLEEYSDSEMAPKIGLGVFRNVIFPQMAGKKPDMDTAMEFVRTKIPPIHDYLESQLGDNDWFVGNRFGLADISIAVQYGNLAYAGYAPSEKRWPKLRAFMARMGERDAFARLHMAGARFFATMEKIEIDPTEGL
jgi:glutathione S-transferase